MLYEEEKKQEDRRPNQGGENKEMNSRLLRQVSQGKKIEHLDDSE